MDSQTLPGSGSVEKPLPSIDYHLNVDTSRPFSSVKEAVAVFGERLLSGEIYAYHKPNIDNLTFAKQESPWKYASSALSTPKQASWERSTSRESDRDHDNPSTRVVITSTLKKLEAELEETKMELKLLKERESETEVALATLNAELHKNMSKIAQAEAEEAARSRSSMVIGGNCNNGRSRDVLVRMQSPSPTLAQILSINNGGGDEKDQREKKKKERKNTMKKKKPIIPLVGDLFSRKKESPISLHNPLYSSSHLFWN